MVRGKTRCTSNAYGTVAGQSKPLRSGQKRERERGACSSTDACQREDARPLARQRCFVLGLPGRKRTYSWRSQALVARAVVGGRLLRLPASSQRPGLAVAARMASPERESDRSHARRRRRARSSSCWASFGRRFVFGRDMARLGGSARRGAAVGEWREGNWARR
jgi:hypothetical protein